MALIKKNTQKTLNNNKTLITRESEKKLTK